eukprot:37725-Prorocentrum_minimum.AAC.3
MGALVDPLHMHGHARKYGGAIWANLQRETHVRKHEEHIANIQRHHLKRPRPQQPDCFIRLQRGANSRQQQQHALKWVNQFGQFVVPLSLVLSNRHDL